MESTRAGQSGRSAWRMIYSSLPSIVPVCLVLLSLCHADAAAAADDGPRCVKVFDATFFENKPDLGAHGMLPIRLAVSLHWWPDRTKANELPARNDVASWVAGLKDKRLPLVVDLEHWPQRGPDAEIADVVGKYQTLTAWIRAAGYEGPVGFYGIPPIRDYWRAIDAEGSPAHEKWVAQNNQWTALAGTVDMLLPSLYTFYEDMDGWETYAIANLREARRLAGSKPVYAFLWPQFHSSNRKLAFDYLSQSMWSRQLEIAARYADGLVIWGGSDPRRPRNVALWDSEAGWWRATEEFLAKNSVRCSQ